MKEFNYVIIGGGCAGTAIRFEPGDQREVDLVPYAGDRKVFGFNGLINDSLH